MGGKIVLVTGGARSGKSTFAEDYASATRKKVAYIATAQIYDEEMQYRVKLHRTRRPLDWITYEAPYDAHVAMGEAIVRADVVLFDCLTLYTSNLLLAETTPRDPGLRYKYVSEQIDKLLCSASKINSVVIFVTNEVGMGIVPDNALAREYRDLAGLVNQKVAARADEVYLVVSGLPVELKRLAYRLEHDTLIAGGSNE